MDYALSHNIKQLDVGCFKKNIEFPLSMFGYSHSLKHLSLKGKNIRLPVLVFQTLELPVTATSTWELPALTTLCLNGVKLCSDHDDQHTDKCVGFFSKCANLKDLTLKNCDIIEGSSSSSFSICHHPGLANLTLEHLHGVEVVNVVAPQLENLIIIYSSRDTEHVISAPDLTSLVYEGCYPLHLSTDGFPSLKQANICRKYPDKTEIKKLDEIFGLLQQLRSVEFLTLNLEIIELLSSSVELISHQSSPFVNLKSLTIYPDKIYEWETKGLPKGKVNLYAEVKSYLLDSSPGATLTMISREEMIAAKDVASAKKLMAKLWVLLEQEKANSKSNSANTTNRGKALMESGDNAKMHEQGKEQPEMKMELQIGVNMIESCWEDFNVHFEQRKARARLIISKLKRIEGLLKKLPTSNRAMIQPCFSSLCAEAFIVMTNITGCMTSDQV